MKKILVFSFFPAFTPSANGGESRLFNLYKGLSKFNKITLLSSTHLNTREESVCHGSNFVERRIPKDHHFAAKWDELTPCSSGGDLSAVCITAAGRLPTLLHNAYLEEYSSADIIIHDSPFTIDYDLFFSIDKKIRVYNSYNCETSLYKILHPKPKSQAIWDIVRNAEVKMLNGCDAVLYCNEDDLHEFKQLAPNAKYTAIFAPNGMSPINVAHKTNNQQINSVVFIGSGHPPNTEAALQIIENIAPKLPNITFNIIGNCLPKGKYPKNVIRHGFVDDKVKEGLICDSDLAINPMGKGSGSNVKVFDFFSYAVPVLSSEFGMRGIAATSEKNCLVAPVSEFSEIIKVWSDRYNELLQIGENGRKFAHENYSWDEIARNIAEKISGVKRNCCWPEKFVLVLNDYDSFKSSGGGGVRTRGIYSAVNSWSCVIFVCFSDDDEITVRYENSRTIVFNIPKTNNHIEDLQIAGSFFHVAIDDIIAHQQCRSNKILISIYNILKGLCRIIVVEHPYMASIPISFGDRFVYSSQNSEIQIKKDILQYHPQCEELISDVEIIERHAIECSAATIAVSEHDAGIFARSTQTSGPIIIVPNGASEPAQPSKLELATVKKSIRKDNSAVFVGSAHVPNIDAVKYIIEELAPACPAIKFHIIGTVCTAFSSKKVKNIHLWGILSESMKSAVMQSCGVALNTVISGGGSNIKLADYFANGLYVVTTPFGLRGYPVEICNYLSVAELNDFPKITREAFQKIKHKNFHRECKCRQYFEKKLSMTSVAEKIVTLLQNFEQPKKKVLVVTYRYTSPTLGGAEHHIEKLIAALDASNNFQIDVVSPEVSKINNSNRFAEYYQFDKSMTVKTGLMNVRFARFPITNETDINREISAAWQAQILFDKYIYSQLKNNFTISGLAWGWGEPEGRKKTFRWGFTSCGLHLHKQTEVHIKLSAPNSIVLWIKDQDNLLVKMLKAKGSCEISFSAPAGTVEITTSVTAIGRDDARPLAFYMSDLSFDDLAFDISKPLLANEFSKKDEKWFQLLDKAHETTRASLDIKLTDIRGPFSPGLENYLENNVHQYDLVVTHNNIFRPAVIAVEKANAKGIPVISIPHAHLDDDFYHFPDVHRSIINSDLVLAAPHIACDFYREKGAKVIYHTPGIDNKEPFSENDVIAFREVCTVKQPFILVLGRKSSAKGYQQVIDAVEALFEEINIHLVMIGPDDDNLPIMSSCVTYLGRQPRSVVRGALLSCQALVNMSSSESFGIVLLEAWMAGKPVIVNNACAAFHDLATDNHNSLIVHGVPSLQKAISKLLDDPSLCDRLAKNGTKLLHNYDWSNIGSLFVKSCNELIDRFAEERMHLPTKTQAL